MSVLGIDLGTGSVKAAVVAGGHVLRKASEPYRLSAPRPGWAEADPAEWLAATRAAVAQATAGLTPTAVGFAGQMHGVVVTDASLRPLRPAIIWADTRATAQAMARDLDASTLQRLGSAPATGFAATTLAWLCEHEPEVMARAVHVLQPKDWLRAALGGDVATDPSDAAGTLLFDVVAGRWSPEAIAWTGIDPALLPPVRDSRAPAGTVTFGRNPSFARPEQADSSHAEGRTPSEGDTHAGPGVRVEPARADTRSGGVGLGAVEIPCVVGGADTACVVAGLGLGPGDGFVAVGSGAQIVRVLDQPRTDPTLRTHLFATTGAPASGWYRIGAVQSAGIVLSTALRWLDASVEEAAAALADGIRDDDPLFVPFLAGERTPFLDPSLRGSWHSLALATDRAAMLRSILEGVAHAVAFGVDAVQAAGDALPEVVPLVGGGTHDPAFRQLLADATGLTLAVTDAPDAAVLGAALLATSDDPAPPPASSTTVTPRRAAHTLLADRRARIEAMANTP